MARVDGHLGPVVAGVAKEALRGDVGILGRDGDVAHTGQDFLVLILRRRRGPFSCIRHRRTACPAREHGAQPVGAARRLLLRVPAASASPADGYA